LNSEKWKRLSGPLYVEELKLVEKAQDSGLTEEEKKRLEYIGKVLDRLLARFLKHSRITREFAPEGPGTIQIDLTDLAKDQEE
jgi:hypothetical protein